MKKRLIRRKRLIPEVRFTVAPKKGEGRIKAYTPPPRGHLLYALVGEISMLWSSVEEMLDSCIGVLADLDPELTACITAQMMGHIPRCLTIIALAHYRGLPDIEERADKLRHRLFEASEHRNRAIHDRVLLEIESEEPFKSHRMAKGKLEFGLKPFDKADLEKQIELVKGRRKECVDLLILIRQQAYEYYD
jgi:hypothetical protein